MSIKTTVAGILVIIGAAATYLIVPQFDGDPATLVNWTAFFTAAGPGFGLIMAKDWNVTGGTVPNQS